MDDVLKKKIKIKQCGLSCILLETVVAISMIVGGIYLFLSDRAWIGLLWGLVCVLILIPPIPFGFECYPVYYKNNPYVVQIKVNLNEIRTIEDSCRIICAIYEYGADKKLFRGHRRRLVYKTNNPYVEIEDNRNLDIRKATKDLEAQLL